MVSSSTNFTLLFDGGVRHLLPAEQVADIDLDSEDKYWTHFSIDNKQMSDWLRKQSGLDSTVTDPLLSVKVRPRIITNPNSLVIVLRVADTQDVAEHDELRSLRLYADPHRIISTSTAPLPVVEQLLRKWQNKQTGSTGLVQLFQELVNQSIRGIEEILEDIDERTDQLESQTLGPGADPSVLEVADLALEGLHLRRCLAPQKEVLARLGHSDVNFLTTPVKKKMRDLYERVCRQLEEAEVNRDRARIIREQLNSHIADQVNQRLYFFSVIAVIFVPLGFMTGLLGVNLGGIPGAESPHAFAIFCGLLVSITAGLSLLFRRWKWL